MRRVVPKRCDVLLLHTVGRLLVIPPSMDLVQYWLRRVTYNQNDGKTGFTLFEVRLVLDVSVRHYLAIDVAGCSPVAASLRM